MNRSYLGLEKDLWFFPIMVIVVITVLAIGLWLIGNSYRNEMIDLREQQRLENEKQNIIWDSLDCSGKKKYLSEKDLRASSLFSYNINEQFYRKYVLECTYTP